MRTSLPLQISVVVPVRNDAHNLERCLQALRRAAETEVQIIVVDDASTDRSAEVGAAHGARVCRLERRVGPAAARNAGAQHATGDVLLFVDADVMISADGIGRVQSVLGNHPEVAAVFGSYDDAPQAGGLVSQYRNLLHHYVHQQGNSEASTFWTGCGAIRRHVFDAMHGFDPTVVVDDIDLGCRLRTAGYRILLDRHLLCTHLKAWTLRSMLETDIRLRAVPWSRLIVERRLLTDDLNLRWDQRFSAALVLVALACLLWSRAAPFVTASMAAVAGVVYLNRGLYAFFLRRRGPGFMFGAVLLHLLYFLYSSLCFAGVWIAVRWRGPHSR